MSDILEKLVDLHLQATNERSHFYIASCIRETGVEITTLRKRVEELEGVAEKARHVVRALEEEWVEEEWRQEDIELRDALAKLEESE